MAKRNRDLECPPDWMDVWRCECCSALSEGVSPPDHCTTCDHAYFENMCDLLSAGGE